MRHCKQKIIHATAPFVRPSILCAALCSSGIATVPVAQAQMPQPGSPDLMSTLRLVAEPGLREGRYLAGIEIAMAPGSHTYWKMPGEAGVPPVFTFNGSENVKSAIVTFPVPQRITEEGLDAFGYTGQVVFPVIVTPADPSKPASLHADVTFAICNRICIPGHGDAAVVLEPKGRGVAASLVEGALAKVPHQVADLAALRIAPRSGTADPSWTLSWSGSPPPGDIFADAPEGFYFTTRKTAPDSWTLTAVSTVTAAAATPVPVTLVLAGPTGALQTTRTLDLKAPGR